VIAAAPYASIPREFVRGLRGKLPDCHRASIYCTELRRVNDLASPGTRVFLGLYYTYWLRPDLLLCRNSAGETKAAQDRPSEELWSALVDDGFTLVVVDRTSHGAELKRLLEAPRPPWLEVSEVLRDEHLVALRVGSRDPLRRPSVRCVQDAGGGWTVAGAKAR
jgi:hypothetical protein